MDVSSIATLASAIGVALGGFAGGRLTGKASASQIASDTVDMLQAQVDLLKENKEENDAELVNLRSRIEVLESLVTQRAEVEELGVKISLVKETVERIAIKVGA